MVRPVRSDDSGLSDWIVLLALVVAVAVVLGAYYILFATTPPAAATHAGLGDTVYIDYIGTFQNNNLVFDTSIQAVAQDNATYPKAFSFTMRSSYSPLQFTIGDGSVVKGFDQGVRGLSVGQTATVVVPQDLGYGPANASLIHKYAILQSFPVHATMNQSAFTSYYGQGAVSNTNVTDPIWGWSVQVSVLNGIVSVTNSPYPSEVLHPYGATPAGLWTAVVQSVDDSANNGTGVITVVNHLDPSLVDKVGGTLHGQTFYLSAIDPSATDPTGGTYTLNYNKQVVGRTLVFQVTLTKLSPLV